MLAASVRAKPWGLRRVSLDADGLPAEIVLSMLADELGVSIVAPEGSDEPMTLRVIDADGEGILRAVADRLGMAVEYSDGVVRFLPATESRSEGYVLLLPGYEDPDEVANALTGLGGSGTVVKRLGGRVMVTGSAQALSAVEEFAAQLARGPDGWLLEVRVFQVSDTLRRDLGLDVAVTLLARSGLRAGAGFEELETPAGGLLIDALVEATGAARDVDSWAELLSVGTLFLLEGTDARLQSGSVVPVPRRTVSNEGTVTTTGFDFIDTGITVEASGRRVPDGLLLTLTPRLSSVTGFVEGAPIREERSVSGTMVIASGQTVLLSGLESGSSRGDAAGLPGAPGLIGKRTTEALDRSSVVVLVTATRVYSSGGSSHAASEAETES